MLDTAQLHLILCGVSCVGGDGEFASSNQRYPKKTGCMFIYEEEYTIKVEKMSSRT